MAEKFGVDTAVVISGLSGLRKLSPTHAPLHSLYPDGTVYSRKLPTRGTVALSSICLSCAVFPLEQDIVNVSDNGLMAQVGVFHLGWALLRCI